MKIELSKKEMQLVRIAIKSAIQNEDSLIDAHTCHFCNGTKVFQSRPCICKTGVLKGSMSLVRRQEKLIEDFKKVFQKFI